MKFAIVILTALYLCTIHFSAWATPMLEPDRKSLTVTYANGDRLEVHCKDRCVLHLVVNGRHFSYTAKDLLNLEPVAHEVYLYSGHGNDDYQAHRERYFGIEIGVDCPEEQTDEPTHRCYVGGVVQDGKLTHVEIYRANHVSLP